MTLCIDSRENSTLTKHVQDYCSKQFVPYEKQWLEVGDYAIGDVCFEAKSTIDFLGSVRNKRLWRQLDSMVIHYKNFKPFLKKIVFIFKRKLSKPHAIQFVFLK